MTVLAPLHRVLTTKLATRSFNVVTRLSSTSTIIRVESKRESHDDTKRLMPQWHKSSLLQTSCRGYATDTSKRSRGRPKGSTSKTSTDTSKSGTSKPGPKTPAGKKKVGRKPKAASTKTKKKASKKPVQRRVKKTPTKAAVLKQAREDKKKLKETALLDTPKKLPDTSWSVLFSERPKAQTIASSQAHTKEAGERYKNLTSEEKEHYNHVAGENAKKNAVAFKQWLSKYTPDQIREANNARRKLQTLDKASSKKQKKSSKYQSLTDERLVKRPVTPYALYVKERWASGDLHKISVAEAGKLIGREWKNLSAQEKKPYQDEHAASQNQYVEEFTTVYGHAPPTRQSTKKTTT